MIHQLNPISGKISKLQLQYQEVVDRKNTIYGALRQHHSIQPDELLKKLQASERQAALTWENLRVVQEALAATEKELDAAQAQVGSRFNPKNWFNKQQKELQAQSTELKARVKNFGEKKQRHLDQLKEVNAVTTTIKASQEAYRRFDTVAQERLLEEVDAEANRLRGVLEELRLKSLEVERVIEPLVKCLAENLAQQQHLKGNLEKAESFLHLLEAASNGYERKQIHEACEAEFGEGRPGGVMKKVRRELKALERDYRKLQTHAEAKARHAARRVEHVVIDGNNLCYQSGQFIGLEALKAILPAIKANYPVMVIFDHSIVKHLGRNEAQLRQELEAWAQVHVAAPYSKADEIILDFAVNLPFSVVLSNDRFADFPEKEVVRKRRVLRHEIVGNTISVYELDLRAGFEVLAV